MFTGSAAFSSQSLLPSIPSILSNISSDSDASISGSNINIASTVIITMGLKGKKCPQCGIISKDPHNQIQKFVKCNTCRREYKTSGNTSNLSVHLKWFHPVFEEKWKKLYTVHNFSTNVLPMKIFPLLFNPASNQVVHFLENIAIWWETPKRNDYHLSIK